MSDPVPHIRAYRNGDESALVKLFAESFGKVITEEQWRWKLKGQPTSVENVWLATCNERPVFQYAGIPLRFCLAGTEVQAMISVDTMTDPEFRRRGLLTAVASSAYAQWREAGIAFVLGLPNEQWGSRAQALGWKNLFPLQWLGCPLIPEAILARRLGLPIERGMRPFAKLWQRFLRSRLQPDPQIKVERAELADETFDAVWAHCRDATAFSTVRDRSWVDWRFLRCPARSYEVLMAYRVGRPIGYVIVGLPHGGARRSACLAELLVAKNDLRAHDTLLDEAMRRIVAAGAESIAALAVPGSGEYSALRQRAYFPSHAFAVQLVPLRESLPLDLMRNPGLWHLSGADFDVV